MDILLHRIAALDVALSSGEEGSFANQYCQDQNFRWPSAMATGFTANLGLLDAPARQLGAVIFFIFLISFF